MRRGSKVHLPAVLLMAVTPSLAHAQAAINEIANFAMPPPQGYVADKTFAYAGDYGYYTAPTSGLVTGNIDESDDEFVLHWHQ